MAGKRAVVFANGEMSTPGWVSEFIHLNDVLIAADGGLNHALALGLNPNFLVGDLDSVTPQQVQEAAAKGCQVERYPEEKDQTDLEIALLRAVAEEIDEIVVLGALGGRVDHELTNLSLLLMPELNAVSVRILAEDQELFLITSESELTGQPGDSVSLLPWGGPVIGVTTRGLRYPLAFETLTPDRSRGVSNVMLERSALVSVESGSLLCIHTRKKDQMESNGVKNEK